MLYISSDHGGYRLKNKIVDYLIKKGYEVNDLGPQVLDPEDDYPDYVKVLANKVLETPQARGILICRNGVGVSIMANKFKGIRSGLSWTEEHAQSSRKDDNTNVLALPADYLSDEDAMHIVETWLNTPFSGEERHIRRLAKIERTQTNLA